MSGFAHLHFEIRRDNSSQSRVENPWGYLPCTSLSALRACMTCPGLRILFFFVVTDTVRQIVYIASHSQTGQMLSNVSVIVSFPPDELDWVLLELEFSSQSSAVRPKLYAISVRRVCISPFVFVHVRVS